MNFIQPTDTHIHPRRTVRTVRGVRNATRLAHNDDIVACCVT